MRYFILLLSCLLTGCGSLNRPVTDAVFGAAGGWIGHAASDGNPAVTAGGAVAGVMVGEGINAWRSKREQDAYSRGYVKGRSDGVKQLYWNLQAGQRHVVRATNNFESLPPVVPGGQVRFNSTN